MERLHLVHHNMQAFSLKLLAFRRKYNSRAGVSLIELLLAIGLAGALMPAILTGFVTSRQGKVQEQQRTQALTLLKETSQALRSVRERGWPAFAVNGTYHPVVNGGQWTLASGSETVNGDTRSVVISDIQRDSNGAIVSSGGTSDPSTKKVTITVSWTTPYNSSVSSTLYMTRYLNNLVYLQSTQADFNADTLTQISVTNTAGGEVQLGNNLKAKWCSPSFSTSTIDLPDGPPVAVAATASAVSVSIPNDVFVATSPYATSSTKLAYLNVSANFDPPTTLLRGTFTLDSAQYSNASYVPSGLGLDNNFKTNDVRYYKSSSGKMYALLATNLPNKEVIAILIDDTNFQDPVNKIYKYWTFFNTRRYQGNTQSTPNQDQTPFGYGGVSVAVLGNRGYLASGGFLYVFDLSNIDSKSVSSGLDEVGCRIELDGYDCNPGSGTDRKYSAGETGTTWSSTTGAAHADCSDGGNIELYANNDIFPVQVGSNTYVYVAVGAGTNPEFNIANVTSVPTSGTSPRINNNSCGTIASGNSGWKRISSLDFNTTSGTEEAANSVFANSDGTRAYISSNGGIDGNGDGQDDSKQFYILNTSNKSSPAFLSGSGSGPTSGYYTGSTSNKEMHPRRSLTVLNGQRVVLVGTDAVSNTNDAEEYQVLNSSTESSPTYCAGINYDEGFNDLTSVTEADYDSFVYMVANTNEKQLKIIQGGPDGTYNSDGSLESSIYDMGYSATLNRYTATFTQPVSSTVRFQFAGADAVSGSCTGANYVYTGPDGTSGTYYTTASAPLALKDTGSGYVNPARCFRYKVYMSTTDYNSTPVLSDMTVNYSP